MKFRTFEEDTEGNVVAAYIEHVDPAIAAKRFVMPDELRVSQSSLSLMPVRVDAKGNLVFKGEVPEEATPAPAQIVVEVEAIHEATP